MARWRTDHVDDDLDSAAREIFAGHHVRLDQQEEVATLIDKLGDMAEDATEKGEQAPTYNLGLVTVPGTNLFTQESLGIPRVEMPQLSGKPLPGTPADAFPKNAKGEVNVGEDFRDELENQGFKVTDERVAAENLRATQMDLVGPQVSMADALLGSTLQIRPICVSQDNYVVDGHHQWAATVLANIRAGRDKFDIPVQRVHTDIGTVLDTSRLYTKAMGLPEKKGTAKTIEAIKRLLALGKRAQWKREDEMRARVNRVLSINLNDYKAAPSYRYEVKFEPSEARDDSGQWTSGGAGGGSSDKPGKPSEAAVEAEKNAMAIGSKAAASTKPEDREAAVKAYTELAKLTTDPKQGVFQGTADAWSKSIAALAAGKPGKGGKGGGKGGKDPAKAAKAAAHKAAAAAHRAEAIAGKAAKVDIAHTNANLAAAKSHAKAAAEGVLTREDYLEDTTMAMLPVRIGEGKLLVPGQDGPLEIDRNHRMYYTWLSQIPEIRRYKLMVGGEDVLS
jgi:hypothetical protein